MKIIRRAMLFTDSIFVVADDKTTMIIITLRSNIGTVMATIFLKLIITIVKVQSVFSVVVAGIDAIVVTAVIVGKHHRFTRENRKTYSRFFTQQTLDKVLCLCWENW